MKSKDLEMGPFKIYKGGNENVQVVSTPVVCDWRQRGCQSGAVFRSGGCWFLSVSSLREPECQPAFVDSKTYPMLLQMHITSGVVKRGCYSGTTDPPQKYKLNFQQPKQSFWLLGFRALYF